MVSNWRFQSKIKNKCICDSKKLKSIDIHPGSVRPRRDFYLLGLYIIIYYTENVYICNLPWKFGPRYGQLLKDKCVHFFILKKILKNVTVYQINQNQFFLNINPICKSIWIYYWVLSKSFFFLFSGKSKFTKKIT